MAIYYVDVVDASVKRYEVEADSMEKAKNIVEENSDSLPYDCIESKWYVDAVTDESGRTEFGDDIDDMEEEDE